MTNEEMERAIEFLLTHQVTLEQRIEQITEQMARTDARIAETNEQLARTDAQLARTDAQLAETDAQLAETDAQVKETGRQLAAYAETQSQFIEITNRSMQALVATQLRTDERMNALISVVERHISDGHGGHA